MTTLVFDIEANGFLADATRIHCIWIEDLETGERQGYGPRPIEISEAVARLSHADCIVGHNVLKYDIPVIRKLYNADRVLPLNIDTCGTRYVDTLVLARLLWPDIRSVDGKGHKLEDWGRRLKVLKGEYTGGFEEWSQEMHDYCEQDVRVTQALFERIMKELPGVGAVHNTPCAMLEHQFAFVMAQMEANGFGFDEASAADLYATLVAKRTALGEQLKAAFPPEEITTYTPKKKLPRVKTIEFNPSSRDHIARRLQALGWEPREFTDGGKPKVDETVLEGIDIPQARLLNEHFLIEKRIGQIAEGEQAWLKVSTNGVIHGAINPNGAVTGRCTHFGPNVSQVPKVGSPYGAECRALFRPTRQSLGWVQVGADLSGIELRCLAHYVSAFDGGAMAKTLLEGDIHWANVLALGLASGDRDDTKLEHRQARDRLKTFIYAFLYGAGPAKIGTILGVNPARGASYKARFLKRMPAIGRLSDTVRDKVKRQGHLRGLDGRRLRIRSQHSALNTLLQSAGALISKMATVIAWRELHAFGLEHGKDWALMAHVHDEMQVECRPEVVGPVGQIITQAMKLAGEAFHFRIPIAGEYHVGQNWRDCH